ncbi:MULTISPECIES: hypothetical protein [Halorussus]|uniref:hypothetical protein n=1 Tax=Halorussus TaxID=1070314 RepID=UPI000E21A591|nr:MULTISPECIES: hypothetical protein [Halorussus]NHN61340.1 hypothetical protein [Halorussus sp. JP-T4]
MDLKDITRGLRGGEDATLTDDEPGAETDSRPSTDRDSATDAASDGEESTDDDSASSDADRDDAHVCPFCETEFDADRGACPECDAEIVLRGTR